MLLNAILKYEESLRLWAQNAVDVFDQRHA